MSCDWWVVGFGLVSFVLGIGVGILIVQRRANRLLREKLARIVEDRQALGDATADMFDQLVRGKWRDDHGHDVMLNKTMLDLKEALRAAALDGGGR